jgi:hypothetical protein
MAPARPQHFATPCADQAARTGGERAHNDGRHHRADNAKPGDPLGPDQGVRAARERSICVHAEDLSTSEHAPKAGGVGLELTRFGGHLILA